MEPELIIKSIMGLIAVLAVLIFFLFFEPSKGSKTQKKADDNNVGEEIKPDLIFLKNIVKNKKTDEEKLGETLDLIIKYYGAIDKKVGIKPHPNFDIYADILFTICKHPHTNKNIIIKFDRELEKLNPEYKKEINEAIAKGLNSRGT
ncbi:MAG: hypothetical protein PHO62_05600 [Sulfurimonas sp.]|uniref:hypothetical protein n=1 Tax=Sulfurimonas sp. TaxID=2022749 RepID=UPI002638CCB5|nr:hypothetical protein [Sulfurimonas sp.]MDD5372884.1 hypothetical protein [Sulfurimonas sp.]